MKPILDIQAILDAALAGGPYESIEELNRRLAADMERYNARPQAELCGLSPDQTRQLLYGDWATSGALRLNESITCDELAGAPIFADTRTLLEYVQSEGAVQETAARNLPRAAVATLVPKLRMAEQSRVAMALGHRQPLHEADVLWLHALRHTLMFANLLTRRKGLRISPRGRQLLPDAQAGALYALIFRTLFREFDLRFFSRLQHHAGLQSSVGFSLYKLRTDARDWASPESLSKTAWLPSAKEPLTDWEVEYGDLSSAAFRLRVLEPLMQFGLLAERVVGKRDQFIELREYRCTPLYDRFLRFEFEQANRGRRRDPFLL